MKKFLVVSLVIVAFLFVSEARAEFGPYGFSNPSFINGNSFNGQFYLDKAKATNEYQDDPVKRIERMMNKMMEDLKDMLDDVIDSIENLNFNFDFNYIIQSGSGNSAIIMPGSSGLPSGFDPSWGME